MSRNLWYLPGLLPILLAVALGCANTSGMAEGELAAGQSAPSPVDAAAPDAAEEPEEPSDPRSRREDWRTGRSW